MPMIAMTVSNSMRVKPAVTFLAEERMLWGVGEAGK
jgi:hypothetical protein